eukprot:818210-Prymnesium_polylepis.1
MDEHGSNDALGCVRSPRADGGCPRVCACVEMHGSWHAHARALVHVDRIIDHDDRYRVKWVVCAGRQRVAGRDARATAS